ncbi:dynamin family protein [Pseudonocardia humida]|uniref:Dynamin family protein n=1 Tax=Pseudonocardia humida TaxID=2800819 RepID=A0ABT1A5K5_9PSEU|nr:dynamin family protein [Pseudonocardia humida]MCO1658306.1 dynamin family protein [Pseudonocardia humida]
MELPRSAKAIDLTLATIAPYQRPDLEARLRQARARLLDDKVRVLVVGEFKQGKSLLVNSLVSAPVCPVYDDVATAVSTVVRYAQEPSLTLVRLADSGGDGPPVEQRHPQPAVPLHELSDAVARHVTEQQNPENRQGISHVEVGIPRHILQAGLEVVDTPGVGGLNSVHGAATMSALPTADAVLLVSDASQEYTAPELEFLRQAVRLCPNVACVLTKTDLYPEWRRIAELDRGHLRSAGIEAELFGVSSTIRWQAVLTGDDALNTESGFPELEAFLAHRVLGQADLLARRSTVHDILAVTGQLIDGLRSEEAAQRNPEQVQELIAELTTAQQQAAALKERSARWQHTLNDGVADLNADIDHDLRDRMREITRLAEEEIDEGGDPTKTWEQLSSWVQQQVASAASTNFVWATERARWLAQQVATHFAEEREALLPTLRTEASDALGSVRELRMRETEPWKLAQKALTGLRGSYMGVLMFGLIGTMVGLSLVNPFSIGAGLLLGGKTISDERRRIITRRQGEAKVSVRRYVDDVTFQVGKDSRDMLRGVQRDLRDHFTELAEQLNRSLKESLSTAERSVKASHVDRDRRLSEIPAELAKLEKLQERVKTLLPKPAGTAEQAEPSARHRLVASKG